MSPAAVGKGTFAASHRCGCGEQAKLLKETSSDHTVRVSAASAKAMDLHQNLSGVAEFLHSHSNYDQLRAAYY